MAPRPSVAPRAPSAGPQAFPTDPALVKRLKSDALAEHFRFAPETFAKGGMDLANRTMYTATAQVEQSLQKLIQDGEQGIDEEEVQRVRPLSLSCGSLLLRRSMTNSGASVRRACTVSRRCSRTPSTPSSTCSRSTSSATPSPSRTTSCRTSPSLTMCVPSLPSPLRALCADARPSHPAGAPRPLAARRRRARPRGVRGRARRVRARTRDRARAGGGRAVPPGQGRAREGDGGARRVPQAAWCVCVQLFSLQPGLHLSCEPRRVGARDGLR